MSFDDILNDFEHLDEEQLSHLRWRYKVLLRVEDLTQAEKIGFIFGAMYRDYKVHHLPAIVKAKKLLYKDWELLIEGLDTE